MVTYFFVEPIEETVVTFNNLPIYPTYWRMAAERPFGTQHRSGLSFVRGRSGNEMLESMQQAAILFRYGRHARGVADFAPEESRLPGLFSTIRQNESYTKRLR